MCRTYNNIGSLSTLKSHLEENNIHDFKSLKEVIDFQKSYTVSRQQLLSHHEHLIEQEKKMLKVDLPNLEAVIETERQESIRRLTNEIDELKQLLSILSGNATANILQKLVSGVKRWNYNRTLKRKEDNFQIDLELSVSGLTEELQMKRMRYEVITSDFSEAVAHSAHPSLSELDRKKTTVDEVNNYIYGALGEQKVVKTLESLPDEYFLINDFKVSFSPALFNKQENDYIRSVQIDHILVGPSGVFLIETKNWSEKSLENLSLRSPVEQIRRANFALFYLLNNDKSNYHIHLDHHHWGDKKIPVKNLIVLTGTKPKEEFQYVKILTVGELLSYIDYFKPIFTEAETKKIADQILWINE